MNQSDDALVIRGDRADTGKQAAGEVDAFVPSVPESLPHLTVPGLSTDAMGISAEVLAQIPTLTETFDASLTALSHVDLSLENQTMAALSEPPQEASSDAAQPRADEDSDVTQGLSIHVESWEEQFQGRIDLLADDIHKLNNRLDHIVDTLKA